MKKWKIELEPKIRDLSEFFLLFKEKIMFKSHYIKPNHRVQRKNEVDTYGASVFAPDYSVTASTAKLCINSIEHSMYSIHNTQRNDPICVH